MPTSTDVAQITYPQSDGQPMADNTLQFAWIVTIQGGLDALFHADPNVFVAGDLLWYPVEGNPRIRIAPDTALSKNLLDCLLSIPYFTSISKIYKCPNTTMDVLSRTDPDLARL